MKRSEPLFHVSSRTPLGLLEVIVDQETLVAAGFASLNLLKKKLSEEDRAREIRASKSLTWLTECIVDYFDGNVSAFNQLKVRQPGSGFSQSAWKAMRKIPAGKVISYATLAQRAGSPAAVRAAGTACGRNAIAPIIPCHRIIRSDGSFGNYGYGIDKKLWLLRHEGAID